MMTPHEIDPTGQAQTEVQLSPMLYIIDDDAAVRDALTLVAELLSLPYETYASADAFLAGFDAAKPGCLILDLRMPGMCGWELVRALTARGIRWPVIVVTGHGDPDDDPPLENGVIAILHKPCDIEVLIAQIKQALAQLGR